MSDEIFLGGKAYVSTKDAARMVGVTGDYISRLARAGATDTRGSRPGGKPNPRPPPLPLLVVDREVVRTRFNPRFPSSESTL
jgi:hypothetical protein